MRLRHRSAVLESMSRHQRVTQCLGSADAQPCWLAVAAPGLQSEELTTESLQLPRWALFRSPTALFYNLELGDTNLTDHNFQALVTPINLILD